jgi:hypothetical protein
MELYDHFYQLAVWEVDNLRTEELMTLHWSLRKAVECGQYKELQDFRGKFCGFVTWEIKPNEVRYGKIDIGITNLVIMKKARGTYTLLRIINYLRNKYPNIASFVWKNRKTKEDIVRNQRGTNYAKATQTNLQSAR